MTVYINSIVETISVEQHFYSLAAQHYVSIFWD